MKCDDPRGARTLGFSSATRLVLSAALLSIACGTTESRRPDKFSVRDSAGVTIAENPAGLPEDVEHWTLDRAPLLEIGAEDRGPDYLLHAVATARRFTGGEVLVVEGYPVFGFRLFDSAGKFLRRFGRQGQGPGEFNDMTVAITPNDSIIVFDGIQRRSTSFAKDGSLGEVRAAPEMTNYGSPEIVGRLSDGTWIGKERHGNTGRFGHWRDSLTLVRIEVANRAVRRIGTFPDQELASEKLSANEIQTLFNDPFPHNLKVAVHDSIIFVGTQDRYEILALDGEGRPRRIIRWARPLVPLTADVIAEIKQSERAALPKDRSEQARAERMMEARRYPDFYPAYGEIRVDDVGNLWVQEYQISAKPDTVTRWTVFGRDGRIKAVADLPPWSVTQFRGDDVMAVVIDTNDIPYVRRYRIAKGRLAR